jgi:glucose-6-phosphate 1-dehydrogenase
MGSAPLDLVPASNDRAALSAPPRGIVLFGIGDLVLQKILPALYKLAAGQQLPAGFLVVGVARQPLSHQGWRAYVEQALARTGPLDPGVWEAFAQGLYYQQLDVLAQDGQGFQELWALLSQLDRQANYLFYLATPPACYRRILQHLAQTPLLTSQAA